MKEELGVLHDNAERTFNDVLTEKSGCLQTDKRLLKKKLFWGYL